MSIRARLLLIALLASLLPTLLVLARFVQDREAALQADIRRLEAAAQATVMTLRDRIQGTAQLHHGLARARDLDTADRATCSAFLSEVRETYPQYTGILTIRPDGRLFCDSLRSGRELDLRQRDYFQRALTAERGQIVLEPAFGRLTGLAVLQVAHAVRHADGSLQHVLLASLNLQKVAAAESPPMAGSRRLLIDTQGQVLAAEPADGTLAPGRSLAGTPLFDWVSLHKAAAVTELPGPGGERVHWALADVSPLEGARLRVLASVPHDRLVEAADQRFVRDIGLLLAAAALLFLAVWLLTELALRRPVARLTTMARRMAGGDLAARIAPPLPRGELGTLMTVLNEAAQALQAQREDIVRLHGQLLRSQRLEAIGQLTGGVAHDFNNLLTVVMGNAEILAADERGGPAQRELAQMILGAAVRGAELTQQLLAFARKQPLAPRAVDVNALVLGMEPLLRRTLGEHVEIELLRSTDLWPAMVDAGQLENAVLNLCLNARDAMEQGGRLTLQTVNAPLDEGDARVAPDVVPGPYVMIVVSDSGCGIAPEHLPRVFEPFFTTKDKGRGTGLGLAMVYGFVKQSAGHVSIRSEPGQGTTVRLYLPRAPAFEATPVAPPAPSVPATGSGTVLVVEDDLLVRRYACRELRALGYRVLEADSGAAALELVGQRDDIDLLFTDVIMPGGLTGRELADAALRLRPAMKVVYTSGYNENAIVHHGRLDPGVTLLSKPYRRAELARVVKAALRAG